MRQRPSRSTNERLPWTAGVILTWFMAEITFTMLTLMAAPGRLKPLTHPLRLAQTPLWPLMRGMASTSPT